MKKAKINVESYEYRIGQNIARLRKLANLRQADMEEYGISRAYYGRIELGTHSLSLKKIRQIATAFNILPSALFFDENGKEIE